MNNIYISRVKIENFRNFKSFDILTNSKQVIFGENESGKSNYIFALQLILDPSLSDNDRQLSISDFNNEIIDPVESRTEITISIFLSNFENSQTILAQLSDATIIIKDKKYLKITYKFYPEENENGEVDYKYIIYKGDDEINQFGYKDRKYLLLKVIKPLRDVDAALKNYKNSPLKRLIDLYEIKYDKLQTIADDMKIQSTNLLNIDEINNLSKRIENELINILGNSSDLSVNFAMSEIEPIKILSSLKMMLSDRFIEEKSLGIKNVLYITMLLLQFRDELVPSLINERNFVKYSDHDSDNILINSYSRTLENNYILSSNENIEELKSFFIKNQRIGLPQVITAIEEPEAHLHPILQRLVYRNVITNNSQSVILTTHSTHITSITPIKYMVHALKINKISSTMNTFIGVEFNDRDKRDIERYIDVSRGEIYFGKGVILVEGIAEEYLIPKFARLLGIPLDENGIVVCNINSTNFYPYRQFMKKLGIPNVVITDGDFYYLNDDGKKEYHTLYSPKDTRSFGYLGIELSTLLLEKSGLPIQSKFTKDDLLENNIFIGENTLEVDIMKKSLKTANAFSPIINTYNDICLGGEKQKNNFKNELENGDYYKCLNKIEEQGIGKGRFAQRFSDECIRENIPDYIVNAISRIVELTTIDE
ncbi:MAG: AAA family ATPase [Spirochaetales bacterium]|nr:AAA family ATPase [Spirochaetales bacterium]